MANVYEDDPSRESQVYISADMQGYLEKKGGAFTKKAKTWCSLQGSSLYLQKCQDNVMSNLDLREAQHVRKIASDTTGTQFEICIKKKSHVFFCPSSLECTTWVKALQKSMGQTDTSRSTTLFVDAPNNNQPSNTEVFEEDLYSSIQDIDVTPNKRECKVSDYEDPYDAAKTTTSGSEYYDVVEGVIKPTTKSSRESEQIYDAVEAAENTEQEVYSDGYSTVNKVKSAMSKTDIDAHTLIQRSRDNAASSADQDEDGDVYCDARSAERPVSLYSNSKMVVEQVKQDPPPQAGNRKLSFEKSNDDIDGDEEDPFGSLMEALTDHHPPPPDFIHPLTEEDRVPLDELTDFLSKHREFCRVSQSFAHSSDDPVGDLSSYLKSLDIK